MAIEPRICVVGSLNVDYFTSVEKLPRPGETIRATRLDVRYGGKGANQALAAARQGAEVAMIGCVGQDEMGPTYLARLREEGVDTDGITAVEGPTGSAFITVDAQGENTIVVGQGANSQLSADLVGDHAERIEAAGILLLQFEVPLEAIRRSMEIARSSGAQVVINPSPFRFDFPWGAFPIDYLIVNQLEFQQVLGEVQSIRDRMKQLQVHNLILTRGVQSTQVYSRDGDFEVATIEVTPVDTVGAGDCFAGTLASRLSQGEGFEAAVRHANIAGALATLEVGAQESIPTKVKVDARAQ